VKIGKEFVSWAVGPTNTDTFWRLQSTTLVAFPQLASASLSSLLNPPLEDTTRKYVGLNGCKSSPAAARIRQSDAPNGPRVQPQDGGGGVPGLQRPPRRDNPRAHHRYATDSRIDRISLFSG
jgi:hypothetical protein